MPFNIVQVQGRLALTDDNGNILGVFDDSGDKRLQVQALLKAGHGLATEETLAAIKDTDGIKKIVDALPAGTNNIGDVDLASSIPAGTNNIGDVDLASSIPAGTNNIGDVDIASAIPAGTNEIGKVAQGTRAAASSGWPFYLADVSGNVVGIVLDGAVYRIQTQSKIVQASDGAQINPATQETLAAIKDTDGIKKIVDALPAGTNEIGKIAQGTKATNSDGWPFKLVDGVNGVELAVARGIAFPTNTRFLSVTGRSDDNFARAIRTDIYGNIQTIPATSSQSAFGETRIAEPFQIANLINKYEIDSNEFGTAVNGSGTVTHLPLQSAIKLYVTSGSTDYAKLRTNTYYRYQAGRGMFIRLTVWQNDTGQTNQVRRWGYFDDNNGLFWQINGTTLSCVRRTNTSGTPIDYPDNQVDWNQDKMNGSGPSGITIDVTKGNIWEIQFQWLGVGVVNWYINGILVHTMSHPNTISGPYMQTACLPLSWEVMNSSSSTSSWMGVICGSIMIEGGTDEPDYTFGVFNASDKTVSVIESPLISIRPKLTYNSIDNRMTIVPISMSVMTDGKRASYRLVLDGSLTGASWISSGSQSGVEYDESATAISGGLTLLRGLLPNAIDSLDINLSQFFNNVARNLRRLAFGSNVNSLTLMGRNEGASGGNTLMRGSVTWQETR